MKPLEPTGEETSRPELLPLERRAILERALSYLERAERELREGKLSPIPLDELIRDLAKIGIGSKSGELHVKLQAHKSEWEKELQEKPIPEYSSFENAKTLEELLERIDKQGGVEGSSRTYLAEELQEQILNILGLRRLGIQLPELQGDHEKLAKEVLDQLPRKQDLRTVVDLLTQKEAPAKFTKGARDLTTNTES